eukprot:9972923-Ditylum_brightwellii.AAC.1
MGTEPTAATEVTGANLCFNSAYLVQVGAKIVDLNQLLALLSTRCTYPTPVKLFEAEFVKLDVTLAGHTIAMLLCGGIFKDKNQDKELIIPWCGTDPDSKINCYSWSKDDSKLKMSKSQHLPGVESIKGPCHIGMLLPMVAKHAKLIQKTCVTY